jgi:CheY-like chemotaxis protein
MNIWTVWNPDYVVDGLIKLATGLVSAATAVLVFAALPKPEPDGATAIDIVRDLEPDVVFMDIGMPGMNGLEAARQSVLAQM